MTIGLVVLGLLAIPLYYVVRGQKIDKKQIDSIFAQHSRGGTYRFELIATSNRKALGMDVEKKGLLFIDLNLKEPYVAFQPLKPNERCEVAIANIPGSSHKPEKVEWVFIAKNGQAAEHSIVFHDPDKNYLVPVYAHEELTLAQQWREAIQQRI